MTRVQSSTKSTVEQDTASPQAKQSLASESFSNSENRNTKTMDDSTTTVPLTTPFPTSSRKGTLYFAFGSNLSTTQMLSRCPGSATPLAVAKLSSYAWFICDRGYANVIAVPPLEPSQGGHKSKGSDTNAATVWGLIYLLNSKDEKNLDKYEGWDVARSGGANPNEKQREWKPMLQGNNSYNKLYLLVRVTKWLVKEHVRKEVFGVVPATNDSDDGKDENLIRTLVYVDEVRTNPGRIKPEYVGRMSRAVAESVPLGIPEDWTDQTMRQHGIVWWKSRANLDASGEGAKVYMYPPPKEQWEELREKFVRSEGGLSE